MTGLVLVCVDGSDESVRAVREGLTVLAPDLVPVVVTAVAEADTTLVTGTGFAGGVLSPEEFDREQALVLEGARDLVADVARQLGLPDAQQVVLRGPEGQAICAYAAENGAQAIVIGSRGHGGVKRAMLGSVSDHVVRNAPCPVTVVGPDAQAAARA